MALVATPVAAGQTSPQSKTGYTNPTSANSTPAYQTTVPQAQTPQQVTAAQIIAAQSNVDPSQGAAATSNADTSSASFTTALQNAQAPEDARAYQQLQESLAASGVVGGGGVGATQQLGLQEEAQFQGNEEAGLLTLKGDEIGQDEFNAGQTNTVNANNATNRLNQSYQNMGASNTASEENAQNKLAADTSNQTADSATDQFNISNLIKAAQGNDATYNSFLSNTQQTQDQEGIDAQQNANADWLAQLNSQTTLANTGQSGQQQVYQPVYTQPTAPQINFSNLGAAAAAPTATTTTTQKTNPYGQDDPGDE